jgi:Flp pilus assembly protein TadB
MNPTVSTGATETLRPTRERQHDESGRRRSGPLASLRWLGRKLSRAARWVANLLRAPFRPIARVLRPLVAPLRWLVRPSAAGRPRGFGFWWLVATLGVAVALGMVVALLLTPVAGLIAVLVVAIWALVRRRRSHRRLSRL